jgi:branched-chain amino acid transport system substrate-binding protein
MKLCLIYMNIQPRVTQLRWSAVFLSCSLLCSAAVQARELVIGQVAAFTNDVQGTAQGIRSGAELYFESVNQAGGINGNTLRLVARDRDITAESAVQTTREFLAQVKPVALLGLMGTGPMQALVKEKVLATAGVPVVGIRSGASSLHHPVNPLLFHTRADYAAEARKAVAYVATMGHKRIALFAERSAYGDEGSSHVEAAMREHSLPPVVARGRYEPNTTNVAEALRQIRQAQPDAILAVGTSNAVAEFYKGYIAEAKGVPIPVIALSAVDAGAVIKRIGNDAAHGLGIARVVPDPRNRRVGIVRELQDVGKRLRGPEFDPTQAELEGYIAARVLVEAIRRAGAAPTPAHIKSELESIRQLDLGGLVIGFSKQNHSGTAYVDVGILGRDGRVLH